MTITIPEPNVHKTRLYKKIPLHNKKGEILSYALIEYDDGPKCALGTWHQHVIMKKYAYCSGRVDGKKYSLHTYSKVK